MRTTPSASNCSRSHQHDGPFVLWPLGILLAAIVGATTACHDDVMKANPMAPAPPSLAVSGDGTWMVNSLADPGDGICSNSECTLREAIGAAQSGERVIFKSNLTGTIALTVGQLIIGKSLTILGPGAHRIAVNGQNLSRVFRINAGPGVAIFDLTITRGNAGADDGGGIFVDQGGRLTLVGTVVTGNSADKGGGIAARGPLTLVGSTVASNTASGVGGGILTNSDWTVRRSTISGNSGAQGGGIDYVCDDGCTATLTSSTITANSSASEAGGIFNYSQGITIYNTIIAGNRRYGSPIDPKADCFDIGGFTSLGYNLTAANTGCGLAGPTEVIVDATQVFATVLEPVLAANGSQRLTHALIERGYAVDAGYCPGESGDQRGFPRPYDDPRMPNALDACDIGAFEWQPADTKIKGPKP